MDLVDTICAGLEVFRIYHPAKLQPPPGRDAHCGDDLILDGERPGQNPKIGRCCGENRAFWPSLKIFILSGGKNPDNML